MAIPSSLETPRLFLRQFVHDDWPAMYEHFSDPECTRFTTRRVLTERQSWMAMAGLVGHWLLRGYGPYAVVSKESNEVLGTVGLWYQNDWPEPEIKWALVRRHWGKGYASEAVRAVQPIATDHFFGEPPISFIDAENAASIKLALSVSATLERQVEFEGSPWHIYRHPKGDGGTV